MTWATDRLDELKRGGAIVPPVVETLRLGTVDDWGPGWAKKTWVSSPEILNGDGSMFGGYVAALADQMLTFAAMTVVPGEYGFRTVNLQVQFFRLTRGEDLVIESRVVAQSKSLIAVEAEFRTIAGALMAKASAQQFLTPFPR
jgi:uncharacterized protein (TIGR00369 family)